MEARPIPTRSVLLALSVAAAVVCQVACQPGADPAVRAHEETVLAQKEVELPATASVAITIHPGKPGALAETMTATRRDAAHELRIERGTGREQPQQQETVALTEREFARLWDIVQRNHLRTFQPQPRGGQVFDFGTRKLRLEWLPAEESEPSVQEATWEAPLENGQPFRRLASEFAKLAKQHGSQVQLYYIREQESVKKDPS